MPFIKYIFLLISLLGILFACNHTKEELAPISYDYFPLEVGKYKIYQVDSTVYNEFNCQMESTSYQIKEVTGNTGYDIENDLYYKVERYYRKNSTHPWALQTVWTEKIEDNQVQRSEDNQRLLKMVFPIKEGEQWDGIVYIRKSTLIPLRGGSIDMYKDWDNFTYQNVGKSFIDTSGTSPKIYPNALEVLQVNKNNKIERRFSKEVYAKNIGLVYKEMWILDTQCRQNCTGAVDLQNCGEDWKIKAEKGFILVESLIEHNY